jgi:hypothetical protein
LECISADIGALGDIHFRSVALYWEPARFEAVNIYADGDIKFFR